MAPWHALVFSARQLVWLVLTTIGSGVLLLVPVFISGAIADGPITAFLRSLHSAASLLLVVGSLAHGALRIRARRATRVGIMSGILASTGLGLAVLSGAILVQTQWWAQATGADGAGMRHASSVFHYGYSAALFGGLMLWHVRPVGARILPSPDRGTWLDALAFPTIAAVVAPADAVSSPYTWVLAPPLLLVAAWPLLVPQLAWAGLGAGKDRERPP